MTVKNEMLTTARDVAKEVGVAISTVGRAMADDPRISADTKAKVRAAAQRLGYVSNSPARMMRGASSKMIGLLIPDVANDFYSAVAQALSTCVDRRGYGLVLSLTQDDRDRELRQIRELASARAAGIILVPTPQPRREVRALLQRIPHVQLLRRAKGMGDAWFGIDDAPAIQSATEHLIAAGHRRIAYIGGMEALSTGAARVAGYRQAMAAAGFASEARLERLGEPVARFGEEAAAGLLSGKNRPTAVVTGSVHITLGLIRYLEHESIDTPRELSVIGFGQAPWFEWWRGGLTTVQPPVADLSTHCALWLLERLASPGSSPANGYSFVTNSLLIERRSVAKRG